MRLAKFHLEKRKDKKGNLIVTNVPIRLSMFLGNGDRLEYYTRCRVRNANNFIKDYFKTGKSPVKSNEPQAGRINAQLKDLRTEVEALYDRAIALKQTPTKEYLKQQLDEYYKGKASKPGQITVKDAFTEYLQTIQKDNAHTTYKAASTTESHFSLYVGKQYPKLSFDLITYKFADGFKDYLIGLGHIGNTVNKYAKWFNSFLNWCKDRKREYYTGDVRIKTHENEIDVIFLNKKEVEHLISTPMPSASLERVKNVFVFGCFSGMRYQDIYNLKKDDINFKNKNLTFFISKGGQTVSTEVPLVAQSLAVLNKYKDLPGDRALPVLSNQKMNDALRDVMKHAGFKQPITIATRQGDGSTTKKTYKKFELISCHTSRKTFITIAISMGMPEPIIKSVTGHSKNSRAFTKYYVITPDVKKAAMNKAFSKKSHLTVAA